MPPVTECRLELLIGRRVVDADGEVVGRLEEVVAELDGEDYVVREFHIGAFAMFERLGGGMLGRGLLRLIGGKRLYDGYVVPWKLMDLGDPERPRVTVPKRELARIGDAPAPTRLGGGQRKRRDA
jgi:sporulation protein YlmC with PRC-barrel domain